MGAFSSEQIAALFPDTNARKIQRNKNLHAAASGSGIIEPTPYEKASGAKSPNPVVAKDIGTSKGVSSFNQPGPAQLAAAESAPAAAVRLSTTSPTIASTANGRVSLFGKDGRQVDPTSLAGKMGKMGQLERDFTGQAALDEQVFGMAMARAKDGTLPPNIYGPPGQGAGTYSRDSLMQQDVQRRDELLAKIDDFTRKNPIRPGAGVGEIVSNAMATRDARREVKALNDNIFGRSDLANKIQMALLDSLTKKDVATQTNQTDLMKQGLENQGQYDTREMMEGHEDRRTAAQIAAGQFGQKMSPKDDPFFSLASDSLKEYYKNWLATNPNGSEDDFVNLVSSSMGKMRNKVNGKSSKIQEVLGKY